MRDTQLLEVDLRSGIQTNESLLAIGSPRGGGGTAGIPTVSLYQAQNAVWNYRYPRRIGTAPGPWMLRQPLAFPTRAATTYTGSKSFRDIGFTAATGLAAAGVLLIGANSSDQYTAWPSEGTAALTFAGGVTRFTIPSGSNALGCSAKWENPGKDPNGGADTTDGVTVFSHLFGTHVYYLLDSATTIRSLTTDTTNCPAGASALAVHLDRLWLLRGGRLYYTDPLNLDSIRTTSIVRTIGDGRCLVPGQFGDIDTSGVPHLIIGSANSVEILDGDPQLGGGLQADKRTISTHVGIPSAHAACVTRFGVLFLGTDGDLWLIPPGCQTMTSVGGWLRDRLAVNNFTAALDLDVPNASIVWFDPYLYIFPGGETAHFYVAEVSDKGIQFWGPMIGPADYAVAGRAAVIRAPLYGLNTHSPSGAYVPSIHSVDITPTTATARYLAFDTRTTETGSYPNGSNLTRAAALQTGLINVPGHRVQVMRVILEVLKVPALSGGGQPSWTVGVTGDNGTNVAAIPVPDTNNVAVGTFAPGVTQTMHFAGPALPANRACRVFMNSTTEASPALQRAFVEIHITKEQY